MDRLKTKTIVCAIGTRPEAIKMAPLILALQRTPWARCLVLLTGQHRELVDDVLRFFGIRQDFDLDVMRQNLPFDRLAAHLTDAIADRLVDQQPDLVLAQGDTTTVVATAMACARCELAFGHVEAGLRTGNLFDPFPEEANRVVASHLARIHFAPTPSARANLIREGIEPRSVFVTGNTVIDALMWAATRNVPLGVELDPSRRLVLITAHRRNSFGEPLRHICRAVHELHARFENVEFLWPVHPNPSVRNVVEAMMKPCARVHLSAPLAYGAFVTAMKRASLILTDSGGVQEEAPAFGKPVLVLRGASERPEAIESGHAHLVGQDVATIVAQTCRLLEGSVSRKPTTISEGPYGDGRAARRIVAIVRRTLRVARRVESSV